MPCKHSHDFPPPLSATSFPGLLPHLGAGLYLPPRPVLREKPWKRGCPLKKIIIIIIINIISIIIIQIIIISIIILIIIIIIRNIVLG